MLVAVAFSVTGDIAVNTACRGRLFACPRYARLLEGASVNGQPQQHEDDGLIELVEALQQVDISSSLAKLNETTIADNNGGRIEL